MENVIGLINLVNEKQYLKELTCHRCLSAVPFGGRYRLIDFTMSNFINADIKKVAVFTKEKYRSLMDHLGSGKEWDLDRRNGGLFILPPNHPDESIKGDLQQFQDHIEFFLRSSEDTVIISPGHHVSKIDFNDIVQGHRKSGADITVLYKYFDGDPVEKPIYHQCSVNAIGDVTNIELYTTPKQGDLVCLETFVCNKELLIDIITKCCENGEYDFIKDGVKANLHHLNVKGYQITGYMPFIHSISSYYKSNMDFLNPDLSMEFFYDSWDVYTKLKHEPPVKYGVSSNVKNSLVSNGCHIEGTVVNSIIFRGVKIRKGAVVKNSIILQKSVIEEGSFLENVITDKQVSITPDQVVIGDLCPIVVKKADVV
ncbi:glucose-1-phosphate adenylyltransferase subunit GlgD [Fredinandcohnia quinoae]|uniref:Glucose-1-phosphate adenylyltransferase subunit GlgD n=1 Tax=Fredinandcohnia quinoae TaxID=2918902 RepID=A0AAW5E5S3_9BACI|nr:glucose-1-phosphate adenylyltransferase subunit GlgD [Fredinandcohnia sp. SECRCQ15]MCH1626879.1 glucose-1-phosphate adenylyltransferase subunit GlgD [Fredinandcohnia sp. SECRCQ15]